MESTEEKPAGQEWQWCLIGNIVGEHKYGETDEIPATSCVAVSTAI